MELNYKISEKTDRKMEDLELTENHKRQIITSIALNKLMPELNRGFVEIEIKDHYSYLVKTFRINRTKNYIVPPRDKFFQFYGNVQNYHELAMLYLEPHMRRYDKMSDFDSSAVLNLIIKASCFSASLKEDVRNVRNEVRNSLAHSNEGIWNQDHFYKCFSYMKSMIKSIPEPNHLDQNRLIEMIEKLENDGSRLLDSKFDSAIISEICREHKILRNKQEKLEKEYHSLEQGQEKHKEVQKRLEIGQNKLEIGHEKLDQRQQNIEKKTAKN